MHAWFWVIFFLLMTGFAEGQPTPAAQSFTDDFLPVWQRAENYMLEVAEAMPAEYYSYRPAPEVFTFEQQLLHIAKNLAWLNQVYIRGEENPEIDLEAEGKSKEEIIACLQESMTQVTQSYQTLQTREEQDTLMFFNGMQVNKQRIFLLMRDHMTHHRAQLILYLRLKGIQPPAYVGW